MQCFQPKRQRSRRAYIVIAAVTWQWLTFEHIDQAFADYLYLDNAGAAHRALIDDFQHARLNTSNLAPGAQAGIRSIAPLLNAVSNEDLKVCQTLQIQYPNGTEFSFRTYQGSSTLDWVVVVARSPQVVMSVVAFSVRPGEVGGPPAVLPPYTPGSDQTFIPPTQLGCQPGMSKSASDFDRQKACQRWPKMCDPRQ